MSLHNVPEIRMVRRLWQAGKGRALGVVACVLVNVGALLATSLAVSAVVDRIGANGNKEGSVGLLALAAGGLLVAAASAAVIGPLFSALLRRYLDSQLNETLEAIAAREDNGENHISEEVDLLARLAGFTHRESVAAAVDWLKQRTRGLAGLTLLTVVSPVVGVMCGLAFALYGVQFTRLLARILESLGASAGDARRRAEYVRSLLTSPAHAGEWRVLKSLDWLQRQYTQLSGMAVREAVSTREKGIARVPTAALVTFLVVGLGTGTLIHTAWRGELSIGALTVGLLGLVFTMDLGPIGDTAVLVRQAVAAERELGQVVARQKRAAAPAPSREPMGDGQVGPEEQSAVVLEVRDLAFNYGTNDGFTLHVPHLQLRRGQSVAIVGPNGSGKTTLLKLLHKDLQPVAGQISINVTSRLSVVSQEAVRYPATLRENIELGDPAALVDRGLALTGLSDLATEVADEILGPGGQGGRNLSGGQWQRVCVARSFARERDLLLLDEPSAALDMEGEAAIFAALREIQRQCAVVVSTHHLANARLLDHIVVLEGGRVVQSGSHDELLRSGGRYAEMFRAQAAGLGVEQ